MHSADQVGGRPSCSQMMDGGQNTEKQDKMWTIYTVNTIQSYLAAT